MSFTRIKTRNGWPADEKQLSLEGVTNTNSDPLATRKAEVIRGIAAVREAGDDLAASLARYVEEKAKYGVEELDDPHNGFDPVVLAADELLGLSRTLGHILHAILVRHPHFNDAGDSPA